ncbi:PepSY-like domain-containing protein [Parapedobacter lycopersici]|uniref:PepSY-like domain-containing protein n=1 Tax=Parapedobacter lycopersici TaxID=1864939 RepID=UPI00214D1B23|nr:PepSY-like domain-containing protein [Parapedobacter lycopersici]
MKKTTRLMTVCSILMLAFTSCDKTSVVGADELPKEASMYLTQHFPAHEVTQVVKERDDMKTTYEVYLAEGYQLEFGKKGEIRSVEGVAKLPDSTVPAPILDYVKTQYPDMFVVSWELDDRGQEVRLSNRMELKFDRNGNFLMID